MQGAASPWPWRRVAITGASSGLGRALALACAAPGCTLHLTGRDAARLDATVAAVRARGAAAQPTVLDVRDAAAVAAWLQAAEQIDLVVANAGTSGGTGVPGDAALRPEPHEGAREVFEVNLTGVVNTVLPARALLARQPPDANGVRGRIAAVASIASFVAAPGAPAYAASKAAVQRWVEALDAGDRTNGVRLHAVCPGYVATPMTAANGRMPMLLSAEDAALRALRGIAAGRTRIAYPWSLYLAARLAEALPAPWRNALLTPRRRPRMPG